MALFQTVLRIARSAAPAALAALVAGCGGSGGGDDSIDGSGGGGTQFIDANHYSAAAGASLSTPSEATGVTHRTLTLGASTIAYTATAGHLSALDASQAPEASIFYVAYTADGAAAATRPVTFFFNGGPGSASIWLHLGSFAPRRLSTGVPATTQAVPFPYVDNAESLIDTSDLVFVDAVGTGLSEAISPRTNQDFWGVDKDAAVLRDFIQRWLAVNGRSASPLFVFGESYGSTRVPVLARLLETAGQRVHGVVELSSIVDYNSNCSVSGGTPTINCAGFLPSYAAVGDWWHVASSGTSDLDADIAAVRSYADATYRPDADAWLANGTLPPADHIAALVAFTGLGAGTWQQRFDMDFDTFRHHLISNTTLGVYDGRMSALVGTPLAADDDPSNSFVEPGFQSEIRTLLPELGYTNPSTYVLSSNAIASWDFSHAGRALPDVVPDLGAALALDPQMKVLFLGGEHDLITPFHQTELDVARLGAGAPVALHFHPGGHMTYLDDGSRPLMKAELAAFYASATGAR
ncbi:MAG: peptidase S10 [Burkholderiales bacterium]|nr:peptidase S10 [Burkholderiales bacterium]